MMKGRIQAVQKAVVVRKPPATAFLLLQWLLTCSVFSVAVPSVPADQFKANNNVNLELGGSWSGGSAPATNENGIWDFTVATPADCTNSLGNAVTWGGIVISNPAATPVYIGGNTILTLNNGISLGNATTDLTVDCGTLNLGGNQTWTVASGHVLTTGAAGHAGAVNSPNNGNFLVTKTGGGVWTTSGNGDNGSTGIIVNGGIVNLNKSSNGGTHSVGGPGLTVNCAMPGWPESPARVARPDL